MKLNRLPNKQEAGEFKKRAGFNLDMGLSIKDNIVRYINWVMANDKVAVFNALYTKSFFSKNKIKNVVFLIRNPFDTYASWVKPARHLNVVEPLGGPTARPAYGYFCRLWNGLVSEYFDLQNSGFSPLLLHYNSAAAGSKNHGLVFSKIFLQWTPNNSSKNTKNFFNKFPERDRFFRLVKNNYRRLYGRNAVSPY